MKKQWLLTGLTMFFCSSLCGMLIRFLNFDGHSLSVQEWIIAGILLGIYVPAQILIVETLQGKPWKDYESYIKLGALMAWSMYGYAAGALVTQKFFGWL